MNGYQDPDRKSQDRVYVGVQSVLALSLQMIEELISRWGPLGIAVGTFFEGETVLFMGGALAHKGLLKFPEVVLAAFVGSLLGDQLWFFLGRRLGARFIARRPNWQTRAERVGAVVARWGDVFVLGFRFVWGLRSVAPFVLANSGYSWLRFAVLNVVGAAIWGTDGQRRADRPDPQHQRDK